MKIRLGFVSNSSSSSFIINDIKEEDLKEFNYKLKYYDSNEIKSLKNDRFIKDYDLKIKNQNLIIPTQSMIKYFKKNKEEYNQKDIFYNLKYYLKIPKEDFLLYQKDQELFIKYLILKFCLIYDSMLIHKYNFLSVIKYLKKHHKSSKEIFAEYEKQKEIFEDERARIFWYFKNVLYNYLTKFLNKKLKKEERIDYLKNILEEYNIDRKLSEFYKVILNEDHLSSGTLELFFKWIDDNELDDMENYLDQELEKFDKENDFYKFYNANFDILIKIFKDIISLIENKNYNKKFKRNMKLILNDYDYQEFKILLKYFKRDENIYIVNISGQGEGFDNYISTPLYETEKEKWINPKKYHYLELIKFKSLTPNNSSEDNFYC
jgi:hypothetical protein